MGLLSGLLGEKCPACGMRIKGNFAERSGKKFCSKECADKWEREEAEKRKALEKELLPCCRK